MKDESSSRCPYYFVAVFSVGVATMNWGVWVDNISQVFLHRQGPYKLFAALLSTSLWLWLLGLHAANVLFNKHKKPPTDPPNAPPGPPATGNGAA
jgi:hypothetical protein